ncbi:hypothetical protein BDA96_04G150200 [Sorghum bicolor]|uniref:Uncharacterized protein n=2 Tax=Sorghum bicolor TaxID=4558 RepID=A0A921UF48_SORBI|nr:hypothetical protein BDA96_05G080000 [Sorghum bicolor]KAG0532957.1 hypothetical protein BDA96_04G150200 [Sorghum bicolor]OQU84907.1 hypothetical protein SORBI_3004G140850 [Sorghum bicolor]
MSQNIASSFDYIYHRDASVPSCLSIVRLSKLAPMSIICLSP